MKSNVRRIAGPTLAIVALLLAAIVPAAGALVSEGSHYAFLKSTSGNTIKWNPEPVNVPFWIHQDVVAAGFEAPVLAAFQTWEDDPGSLISFDYRGTTTTKSDIRLTNGQYTLPSDGKNVVSFAEVGPILGRGGLSQSGSFNGREWTFTTQFDVSLTTAWQTTLAVGAQPGKVDVETVVLHELGHVLGLDHPSIPGLLMSAALETNSTHNRELGPGERAAVATLYPAPAITGPSCDGLAVTIDMTAGDRGVGTDGDDVILGTEQADRIFGMGGDDVICGEGGVDRLYGGDGDDRLFGGGSSDRIKAGAGEDTVYGGSGADKIWGGDGPDSLFGGGGQDRMYGEAGNDLLQGNHSSDDMWGGDGNDTIRGSKGKDEMWGDSGDDMLYGGVNSDDLEGGSGADHLDGQQGSDTCTDADPFTTRVSC